MQSISYALVASGCDKFSVIKERVIVIAVFVYFLSISDCSAHIGGHSAQRGGHSAQHGGSFSTPRGVLNFKIFNDNF